MVMRLWVRELLSQLEYNPAEANDQQPSLPRAESAPA